MKGSWSWSVIPLQVFVNTTLNIYISGCIHDSDCAGMNRRCDTLTGQCIRGLKHIPNTFVIMRNIQNWSQFNYNAWDLGHRLIVFNNRRVMGYFSSTGVLTQHKNYHLFQAALTMATALVALDGDENVMF